MHSGEDTQHEPDRTDAVGVPGTRRDAEAPPTGPVDQEDLDRRLGELSAELRLLMPATTVFLAFLLTVPFSSGWSDAADAVRISYFVAFLSCAAAVVLFAGEGAYHRVRGYPYDKAGLLRTANRQAVTGIGLLAVALGAVTFLVSYTIYGQAVAIGFTLGMVLLALGTWLVLPLMRRLGR